MGFELFILLLRGPHCSRYTWFGYEGGLSARKGIEKKPFTEDIEKTGHVSDQDEPTETEQHDETATKVDGSHTHDGSLPNGDEKPSKGN